MKREKLSTTVDPSTLRKIEAAADRDGRSVANWLRFQLERLVAGQAAMPDLDRGRRIADATRQILKGDA